MPKLSVHSLTKLNVQLAKLHCKMFLICVFTNISFFCLPQFYMDELTIDRFLVALILLKSESTCGENQHRIWPAFLEKQ